MVGNGIITVTRTTTISNSFSEFSPRNCRFFHFHQTSKTRTPNHWRFGRTPNRIPYAKFPVTIASPIKPQIVARQVNGLKQKQRRPQNVEGEFYVDHTCINCDTCRWMAPEVFKEVGYMAAVYKQPTSEVERLEALQALLSCPTNSIHTEIPPRDILEAQKTFPIPVDDKRIPGVYHCGYHSAKSYGAASYLIVHAEGNILVDSPRFTESLARNIEMLGGARFMFLTHRDDIADHDKWSKRLNCERILHSEEVESSTSDVERKLEGAGPWSINQDMELIHTPGHTEASVCLYYKSLKVLFTGDHLAMGQSGLSMGRYNWFSVPMQVNSVRILLDLDFEWILPGHGRRAFSKDTKEKNSALETLLATKMAY